jgi:hypothetical protein
MRPGHRFIGPKQIEAPLRGAAQRLVPPDRPRRGSPAARLLQGGLRLETSPPPAGLTSRTGQRGLDNIATAIRCRDLAPCAPASPSSAARPASRQPCCPHPPTSSRCWTCGDQNPLPAICESSPVSPGVSQSVPSESLNSRALRQRLARSDRRPNCHPSQQQTAIRRPGSGAVPCALRSQSSP